MKPYLIGKIFGTLFWGFLLAVGIVKCFLIAKRETTCSKCVYGLMITLSGLFFLFIVYLLKGESAVSPVLGFLLGMVWLMVLITAVVLSIIGLVEYKKHEEYIQGRKQAITAIVLSTLFIGLVLFGVYRAIHRRADIPRDLIVERAPGTVRVFGDLNFKYKFPDKPWAEMAAKKVNPDAVFAMLNARLKVFFLIIAEKGGVEIDMDSSALAEISRASVKSVANNVNFSDEKKYEVNGLTGIRFYGDAEVTNRHVNYAFWVCSHNGYLYQLITFGVTKNSLQVRGVAEELLARFEQLDKNKVVYAVSSNPFGTFTSRTFNYTVDLKNTHWLKWNNLEEEFSQADCGGTLPDSSWFSVIPFYYGNLAPSLDTLSTVLLQYINEDLIGKPMGNLTPVKEAGMKGHRFMNRLKVEGTNYVYHHKVLKGKECGYLVTFVTEEANSQAKTLADQVFDAVTFRAKQSPGNKQPPLTLTALTDREKDVHSEHYNYLGLFYFNAKQYQKSLPLFKTAVRLNPKYNVFVENVLNAYFQLKKYQEGLTYLETLGTLPRPDKNIRAWKAAFLAHLNRPKEGIPIFKKLFEENYRNDEDFVWYARLLTEQGQGDLAAAAFEKYLEQGDSLKLRLEQAHLLYLQEKYRDAIKHLNHLQAQGPFNAKIAFALIKNYRALEEYKEGLEVCQHIIDKGFASKNAYYEKGLLEFDLNWYRKAKESFEKALSYAPQDKDIQEDLKYVSGLLGEGDNTLLKGAIPAVPIPEVVKSKLSSLTIPSPPSGYGAYYISRVEGIQRQKGKGTKFTIHEYIKVLDAGGVSRFSTLRYDFNPLREKIFVNRLIVCDPEGKIISRGRPTDYYVVDDQNGEVATHDQTLHVPVPHLLPGYTIQLTRTIERFGTGTPFAFYSSTLSSTYPIVFSARYVLGDLNKLSYKSNTGVKTTPFQGGMLWYMDNPPVYQWEPEQAVYSSYLPMVWINDSALTWQEVGSGYLEDIREKLEMGLPEKALARQLTKGMSSNRQKIDALVQYIQTKYTYKAIEFGWRSLIPNKASQIIANKYGDCKDHALLLHQLLKAVDITSYLALVNSEETVKPEMPSIDQFNHMIVYIPGKEKGGGGFIDTTDKGLDPRIRIPSFLGGKQALVLNPGNIGMVKIPGYNAGDCTITIQKNIRIDKKKEMKISETLQMVGYIASFTRSYFKTVGSDKQLEWGHRVISRYLDAPELETIRLKNLYDNSKPLMIELEYKAVDQSCTPNALECYYLEVTSVKDRKTPFKINHPFVLESNCTLKVPTGFTFYIRDDYNKPQKYQTSFSQWEGRVRPAPRELYLHLRCTLVPGDYGADRYSQYSKMVEKAAKSMAVEFKCLKGK